MHKALQLLRLIPRGRVVTYKELARACGTSPRAVGRILAGNKEPAKYPCYKVVSSRGALTGYSAPGGLTRKRELLERDGATFARDGRVLPEHFYRFEE
ncbi:MAG: MGMT family protein [bacterium]|nr:MGMT family protein [bacterium]MDZ4284620.1 MGMT family protein [Patescibacteria group bacterium]